MATSQPTPRKVKLFRNNRNQAVRISVEFEFPGDEVMISRTGERRILEPVRRKGLLNLLASWTPRDEGLPDIEDIPV